MKIIVVGANGMLGHKLAEVLGKEHEVWALVRHNAKNYSRLGIVSKSNVLEGFEAADIEKYEKIIEKIKPEVVINAVGIIKQRPSSKDVITALTLNSIFPHRLAQVSHMYDARFITIGTDCVFTGIKGNYSETDLPDAYDIYGRSKNLGEVIEGNALTLRTSIIGHELNAGHSLLEWFLSRRGEKVKGYKNAIFSGFPTVELAGIIKMVIERYPELRGLYHVSSEPISKHDLLKIINEEYDLGIDIEPDYDFKIDRSLDSTKFRSETGFEPREWNSMIKNMAKDAARYDEWKSIIGNEN